MLILRNKWSDHCNNYSVLTLSQPNETQRLQLNINGQLSVIFSYFNGNISTHNIEDLFKPLNQTNFMIADYNLNTKCEEENEKIRILTKNSNVCAEIHGEKQNIPLVMSEDNKNDSFLSFCFRNIYTDRPTDTVMEVYCQMNM